LYLPPPDVTLPAVMLTLQTSSAFSLASVLLAVAPGPDNIFVLTQSALYGRLSGLVVMFGLCTGLLVHTTAVAFGVAVIFQASTLAFILLKTIGGTLGEWLNRSARAQRIMNLATETLLVGIALKLITAKR